MQVKQTKAEKLQREYTVKIPAASIDEKIQARLQKIGKTMKVPGFRPGKVPMDVVKKQHGKSVLGEVLDLVVQSSTQDAFKKEGVRPAIQPKIEIVSFEEGKDLEYTIACEILPEVPKIDFAKVKVEKPLVELEDQQVIEALDRIAGEAKDFQKVDRAAKQGDAVKLDFKGFVDGEAFEGGAAQGHRLELGSNSFIPGFEDQLVGAKAGEKRDVKVTFPKEYHSEALAGKDAVFECTVHEVLEAAPRKVDDSLAQAMGLSDLEVLKEAIRAQLQGEVDQVCRARAKKSLFDGLDEAVDFQLPDQMVNEEFNMIWKQVEHKKEHHPDDPELNRPEKELQKEYLEMAVRRVKLGIVLAEIGEKEKISVSQDELNRAMLVEARQYPGQEQAVIDYYRKNPHYMEMLKGPVLEEKVVDFLLQKVSVEEKPMTLDALQAAEDDTEAAEKPKAKKAATSKSSGKKPAAKKGSKSE